MSETALRSLPIWKQEIRVEILGGGLTNLNYKVTDGDAVYAARQGDDDPELGISRANEITCTAFAAERGIAPRLVHASDGVMVSDFVDAAPLTPERAREPRMIARVAARLREIHGAGTAVRAPLLHFSPFAVARGCLAVARRRGLALPAGDAAALAAGVQALEAGVAPFRPTFCHNDLMPGNLLDDGAAIWVIDWEYAGIGHPWFDLAGFSNNCDLDATDDHALLRAYGIEPAPPSLRQFGILKAMAALRESLWAVVKGSTSTIDFDYLQYRDDNFAKFEQQRAAL